MTPISASVVWSLLPLIVACSAQPIAPPRPTPAASAASAPPPATSSTKPIVAFGDLPPAPDPRVEQRFAAVRALRDANNMMWAKPQTPPEHWRGLLKPLKRPFPGVPYDSVRAFTFGNDRAPSRNRGIALFDRKVPGCGNRAVAEDGTLCPSLNPPGKLLTQAQSEQLVAVLEDGQPKPGRAPVISMCLPVPTVLFVFYAGTRPVAEMWLDPRCGYLGVHARASKLYPETYMAHGKERLAQFCSELSLVGSGCEPEDPEREAAFAAQAERDGDDATRVRWHRVPLGVSPELKISALSAAQKERLCFDYARENPGGWGSGFECINSPNTFNIDPDTCVERFPSCDATVGELVACQRHALVDRCFKAPEAAHCLALRPCFFGTSLLGPGRER